MVLVECSCTPSPSGTLLSYGSYDHGSSENSGQSGNWDICRNHLEDSLHLTVVGMLLEWGCPSQGNYRS